MGTVCLIELCRIVSESKEYPYILDNESIVAEIMAFNGLQRIKSLLKDDKDESHTYWALVFLSLLCGTYNWF